MIKILLADDDILALNRLMNLINWNEEGYEIVGQALGGNDCLEAPGAPESRYSDFRY